MHSPFGGHARCDVCGANPSGNDATFTCQKSRMIKRSPPNASQAALLDRWLTERLLKVQLVITFGNAGSHSSKPDTGGSQLLPAHVRYGPQADMASTGQCRTHVATGSCVRCSHGRSPQPAGECGPSTGCLLLVRSIGLATQGGSLSLIAIWRPLAVSEFV